LIADFQNEYITLIEMFKQITPTFEAKYTFEEQYANDDLTEFIHDTIMMERCKELTTKSIDAGVSLNAVCQVVKDFQQKYIHIHKCDPNMSKHFTVDMWWATSNINFKNKV
jgi:hypothetical protein